MFDLTISDPWQFGTDNGNGPFQIEIKKGNGDSWLVVFEEEIFFDKKYTKFLLGKFQNEVLEIESNEIKNIQLAFIENLNEINFYDYDFNKIRSNFLKGKIYISG